MTTSTGVKNYFLRDILVRVAGEVVGTFKTTEIKNADEDVLAQFGIIFSLINLTSVGFAVFRNLNMLNSFLNPDIDIL